jgi:hypothetical protein
MFDMQMFDELRRMNKRQVGYTFSHFQKKKPAIGVLLFFQM